MAQPKNFNENEVELFRKNIVNVKNVQCTMHKYVYKTNQHTDSYQNAVFLCFGTDKN